MQENENNIISRLEKEINDNKKLLAIAIINTVLSIVIILLLLLPCSCPCHVSNVVDPTPTTPGPHFDPSEDPNIEIGPRPEKTPEEIQEELHQKMQEGMMNISMNTNPCFDSGTSEGNLLITNADFNRYPQIVEIYRDDTGELIYKSGAIPVGARLDYAKLSVDLPMGIYDCTAHFNQIDDAGYLLGKACAKIKIYILS